MKLILASTSVSRQKILKKFNIPFDCIAPDCDETPQPNENAITLVQRLSCIKAESVAKQCIDSIIIGSDQVGVLNKQIIGKPHTVDNAIKQLQACSGKTINFYTGLTVIDTGKQQRITIYEPFAVTFRQLSLAEISAYVEKEQPLYCAGSFKCDELGITLFDKLMGDDINTLIGLPLIRLNKILIKMGYNPLLQSNHS
ncbi:MAG: septum formation inhibitor Maf [Candidatus Schmidhempelia sp.]|nr:septum formation inhibitor Maf [Candidatus Schmidhempelia sp.]